MAAKNLWIAVPTYWTFPSNAPGKELTVFDHPTPLDEAGTLARTLDSFTRLKGNFEVIVVAAAANPGLGDKVHARVSEILAPFKNRLKLTLVSPRNLPDVNKRLPDPILSLDSYGNIRNVQLLVPILAGADAVLGIDDDEVIEDPGFLAKAAAHLGELEKGEMVGGMAGPYFDAKGEYQLGDAESLRNEGNIFLKKNFFMNEALKKVMTAPCPNGIIKSNVAFGGDMVMSRDTIARVCHDPYIPRGEDYDYVVNAAMQGILFFFQPGMRIIHLPPDSTGSQAADKCSKLVSDIRRFIYMQIKMRVHRERFPENIVPHDYLFPYPGPYLEETADLKAQAAQALRAKYPEFCQNTLPEALVAEAVQTAEVKVTEFFDYVPRWQKVMKAIAGKVERVEHV